ncbi:MAG: DUF2089 domain-containing protein [Archangium sp.]|nr:DUF2089 domain-containing protein [Archangium sp.]
MSRIDASIACPSCRGPLRPAVLECGSCGVRVEGPFQFNEFASLDADDLHLLRIFVLSEGRIRDMEAPLGLSYPTIRTRLSALREKVARTAPPETKGAVTETVDAVLERLQRKEITFDEAMKRIHELRGAAGTRPTTPRRGKR